MTTPTPEQLAKLPKWAQEHIQHLDKRCIIAERALLDYTNTQTPSSMFYDELVCIGDGPPTLMRKYVQTKKMSIIHDKVRIDVQIRAPEKAGVEISWSGANYSGDEIPMIPTSYQTVKIIPKDKLR
jgi:hypothetical protein